MARLALQEPILLNTWCSTLESSHLIVQHAKRASEKSKLNSIRCTALNVVLPCSFCRRKYLDHGCHWIEKLNIPLVISSKTEQRDKEVSERQIEEKLNVEDLEREQHLEMPGGIDIPLEDIKISLEGAEFVIPDADNSQEMSLEGAQFVIQESGEIQGDYDPKIPKQSTKLIDGTLTESLKNSSEETDETLSQTFEPTTRKSIDNDLTQTFKKYKQNSSEEKYETKILTNEPTKRKHIEIEFRENDDPSRRYFYLIII